MKIFSTKRFDKILLLVLFLIFGIGLMLVASATKMSMRKLTIQGAAFILGLIFMYLSTAIDYSVLKKYDWYLYALSIIFLLLVYIPGFGIEQFSARSWVNLYFMQFQTSEATKVTYTLAYSAFLERRRNQLNSIGEVIPALLYPLPIVFLLKKQPDLGGILVIFFITIFCLFMAGLNKKYIIGGIVFMLIAVPIIYKFQLLELHQMQRLEAFLHPGDPAYIGNEQVIQSITAIGSGQLFGKGWLKGTLIPFGFLPVPESDFIFAVLGEEFGMVGMGTLIVLFFIFLSRIYSIAMGAKDFYGTLIVSGFLGMLFYQVLQNIGMTIGLMPVTGVTLPFVSYGGSSVMMGMVIVSIIMNVYGKSHSSFAY